MDLYPVWTLIAQACEAARHGHPDRAVVLLTATVVVMSHYRDLDPMVRQELETATFALSKVAYIAKGETRH